MIALIVDMEVIYGPVDLCSPIHRVFILLQLFLLLGKCPNRLLEAKCFKQSSIHFANRLFLEHFNVTAQYLFFVSHFSLAELGLSTVVRGVHKLCRFEFEECSLVFVKHSLEEVSQNSHLPYHIADIHLFVKLFSAFQKEKYLPSRLTCFPQEFSVSKVSKARHH